MLAVTPAALIAFAVFHAATGSESHASGQSAEVYLITGSASSSATLVRLAPEIAAAHRASSISEVMSLSGGEPAVVMIDEEYAKTLAPESLHQLAAAGYALIGLNIPLDKLGTLTEFKGELGSINPMFSDGFDSKPATFVGPFFTIEWRSPPGANPALWGQSQHELTPGMFAVILKDYRLRVRGLIANSKGTVVPLEQWASGAN